jgi:hypothetical protein
MRTCTVDSNASLLGRARGIGRAALLLALAACGGGSGRPTDSARVVVSPVALQVGAGRGLGHRDRADDLAARHRGQVLLLLRVAAI